MAGNTVAVKSSDKVPLISVISNQIPVRQNCDAYGKGRLSSGVINIISGHGQIPGNILSHRMDVRALSFTGSGITGRLIQSAAAASNMENVILELGGKSLAIIFSDADIAKAVEGTKDSIQWDSG
ncbi:Aldehyde dehydrogenase N-terminal [Penicillium cf. viridicatum]|uniref:aldehyde dehydrogenase (NAD(+)) n=1 Tax=Penicillium cf. viridicatum TaxID=2972119 RepID=A0A9W9JC93_9EURO|nr:Aldehyde dehydrogenase N-terminal [Penicillium cf. viridicatum]